MKKNQVQFQSGMSLMLFLDRYGSEQQCREALAKVRWPDGFRCQGCGRTSHCHLKSRDVYQCNHCKRQESLTSGTLFAESKLPLRTWFLAIYLLTQHKNGISALALRRQLGVSYNTAWLLKHKLMQAMVERDSEQVLAGIVMMDDAYWGGERHGSGVGRGSPGKTPFVAAVQCTAEGHPIAMRMDEVPGFRKTVLAAWAQRHLAPGTAVVTDGLKCFPGVTDADCTHTAIPTGGGVPDLGHPIFTWVNTMLGNVKNAMHGTYHAASEVPAALFVRVLLPLCPSPLWDNRRFDLAALVPRLIVAAARTPPLSYRLATLDA